MSALVPEISQPIFPTPFVVVVLDIFYEKQNSI